MYVLDGNHSDIYLEKKNELQVHRLTVLPGILLRVLEVFWDESKVFAQFQPQVRLWHPAIVGMDGVVLGQLPRDQPEM